MRLMPRALVILSLSVFLLLFLFYKSAMFPQLYLLSISLYLGAQAICDIPPCQWCDNYENAKKCRVTDQCTEWLKEYSSLLQVTDPVHLTVFYESLCPDSTAFFKDQLGPTYDKLGLNGILDIDLVPYGNAAEVKTSSGQWNFTCQHGQNECHGNIIQSCSINYLKKAVYFPFIRCMMARIQAQDKVDQATKKCIANNTDSKGLYDLLMTCAAGKLGNTLEHQMGLKTEALKPIITYVPWVTINGKHTEEMEKHADSHLLQLVCDTYEGTKPAVCEQSDTKKKSKNKDNNKSKHL